MPPKKKKGKGKGKGKKKGKKKDGNSSINSLTYLDQDLGTCYL